MSGVYAIFNTGSGRTYIGSTTRSIITRIDEHFADLRLGEHDNDALQADFRRLGKGSFDWRIVSDMQPQGGLLGESAGAFEKRVRAAEAVYIETVKKTGRRLYNEREPATLLG